jgi:acyl-CoA reductase-like NAD-dependent aldehyde dehydrogenase
VVLNDADVDLAIEAAYASKMINNGQCTFGAQRFII